MKSLLSILMFAALVTESFAQRIEVIKPSGTKSVVTMQGAASITEDGTVTTPGTIVLNVDGAGTVLTTGIKGYVQVPWNCTITGWTLLSKETGSVVIDIWRDFYANYPPTVADTIIGGGTKPNLSSANKATSGSPAGWVNYSSGGMVLGFNIDSVTTITKLTLILNVTHQ